MRYLLIVLFIIASGCSKNTKEDSTNENSNLELTHGYSFVYKQLGALIISENAFFVRNESEQVRKYGEEASEFAKKLKKDLETLSEKQKNIKLDDTGQSKAESMMFDSISKDTAIKYLPVIGLELKIFERKYVLSTVGLLTQIHFMFGAIMELETSEERKKSLKQVYEESARIRLKGVKILNETYYKHNEFD